MAQSNRSTPGYAPKFLGGLLLLCAFVLALAAWSLERSYANHQLNAEIRTQNVSLLLLDEIGRTYDEIDRSLILMADDFQRSRRPGGLAKGAIDERIARVLTLHPELVAFRIANTQGEIIHGISNASRTTDSNILDRAYFQQLRDDPDASLVLSEPLKGKISGKWGVIFARRLLDGEGRFAGVVIANLKLDYFLDRFAEINLEKGGAI